jgi:hypothetical protein
MTDCIVIAARSRSILVALGAALLLLQGQQQLVGHQPLATVRRPLLFSPAAFAIASMASPANARSAVVELRRYIVSSHGQAADGC